MPPIVQQKSKQISNSIQMPREKQEQPGTGISPGGQNKQPPKLTSRQKKVLSGLQEEIVKLAEETEAFAQAAEKELAAMQKPGTDPTEFIRSIALVNNGRARQYEKQYEFIKESMRFQNLDFTQECEDRFRVGVLEGGIRLLKNYEREPYSRYADLLKDFSKLRESLESELEGLQRKLAIRQELKENAKAIADKAHVYQESGFQEGCSAIPEQELFRMYLDYADKLWEKQTRKEYLSAAYISEHIVQSLSVLEVGKAFQMKRGDLRLTPEEQEQLVKADQIFQYYRQHVDTVLGDYGMSLDNLSYNGAAIEDLVSRKHTLRQSDRWCEDYEAYHRLLGIREEPDTDEEAMSAGERRLRNLERRAGILVNDSEGMTAAVYDKDTGAQFLESRQRDVKSYVRLKKDILTTTAERRQAFDREHRLLAVSKVFIARMKQDKVWSPDLRFNEIPKLLIKEIFSYDSEEKPLYVREQMKLLKELTERLNQILLTSPVFRERQFASVMLRYLSEEQNGELVKQKGDTEYRAEDRNYVGMNKVIENEKNKDKQGKPRKYIDTFESVKDEPLFAHDPVIKDLEQGYIGDCYFIASLASLVARDPGAVKRMMRDNGDGTVTVRFYDKNIDDLGTSGTPGRICVTVDKTIPMRMYLDTKFRYTPYSQGALWVKMMEKAYAAVRKKGGEITVRRKGASIDYKNLMSGQTNVATMHLTGEDVIGCLTPLGKRDIKTFKGRIQSNVDMSQTDRELMDQNQLKRPANLYFYQQHRNEQDKAACRYLAGKRVLAQLAAGYKQELNRYQTVEKWLEALLEEQEGKEELKLMDTSLFVEAIARQISYLRTCLGALRDHNGMELTNEMLLGAGIVKKWHSTIRGCWKVCDKNADTLLAAAEGMLGAFAGEIMKDRQRNEYTAQEEKLYSGFQDVLKKGGSCFFGTRRVLNKNGSNGKGRAGETVQNGIYGNHAYAVIGTEEHQIGNRVKKFLRVFNPHATGIPLYQLDERNNLKRVGIKSGEEQEYLEATHGVFLLELRDLYGVMSDMSMSKLPVA